MTVCTYIGIFFLCLWIADFLTGLAHWAEDTYCQSGYPIIGALICEPNLKHHEDPNLMVRTGNFFSRNWIQWLLCAVTYGLLWLLGLGYFPVLLILLLTSFGNEVHYWNHTTRLGWLPTFIKMTGLVQSQKQHSLHHKPPHTNYYCVLTSFLNPLLELVKFWRGVEWLLARTFGLVPIREGGQAISQRKKSRSVPARSRKTVRIPRSVVAEPR
ncbi:MAG: fatty acid desaturase family protein [Mariniblastus sp.]|nr:fatty acid desaturase family protein [Mariniblastus sp.]